MAKSAIPIFHYSTIPTDVIYTPMGWAKSGPFGPGSLLFIKAPPYGWVMFIGYAVKPFRDEVRLHAASTPTVEAVFTARVWL